MKSLITATALASVTTAIGLAQVPRSSIQFEPSGDGRATLKVRNESTDGVTAYLLSSSYFVADHAPQPRRRSSWQIQDAVALTGRDVIGPHETIAQTFGVVGATGLTALVQAALFADGFSFGDPDWAAVLREHHLQLDALASVLRDLAEIQASHNSSAIALEKLKASQTQKVATADATVQRDIELSKSIAPDCMNQLFAETTPAMKAANIQIVMDQDRRSAIRNVYRTTIINLSNLPRTSEGTQLSFDDMIRQLLETFEKQRQRLVNSKPAL